MQHWKRWALACALCLVVGSVVGVVLGYQLSERQRVASEFSVTECFTPGEDCTQFVVNAIEEAQTELRLQAFNYTSPPIIAALARAKVERGVDVRIILDKSNEAERYSGGVCTEGRGIPVVTDSRPKIAHNKLIIIDRKHVLGGSFNFTVSAQKSNAENVMLVRNSSATAKRYLDNWERRLAASREFRPRAKACDLFEKDDD